MVAGQLQVLVISFFWQLMAWFLMSLQPGCGMKQEAYIGTDAGCVWVWVWVWVCVCVLGSAWNRIASSLGIASDWIVSRLLFNLCQLV